MGVARLVLLLLIACGIYYASISLDHPSEIFQSHQDSVTNPSWNKVVEFAKDNLPQTGVLVQKADGYVYLKVDDRYIHQLFPMLDLKKEGFKKPPFFRSSDSPGAHITVFNAGEHIDPREVGRTFGFTPKKIVVVKASKNEYYAILKVDSPELEALRNKYALKGKPQGHELHISLAKKYMRPFH